VTTLARVAIREHSATDTVVEARARYVAAGVATPPFVVARAEGAHVEDVDGRAYVDFAGGLGCQNTGHGLPSAVAAIHEQVDRYLHQCFMVGMYEPYVEVCRRLAELSPCRGVEQKSLLLNSGAEAVENAVKIARVATGRPAVVVFDRAFHGRTLLAMTMTSKVVPYKRGFGPFAPEVYRAPAPYPYRGVSTDDAIAGLEALFKSDVDPKAVACVVLEPVQGEGGFVPMPRDFPPRLRELCDRHGILYVDDEVQSGVARTGPVWAIEHYGVEPDLLVSGKSLGGGLPLAAVTGRSEVVDAVAPGGLGGTFGGNPVACAAAVAVLDEVVTESFQRRARELGERIREALDGIASRVDAVGEVRGLGPMLALELVDDRETKAPASGLAGATVTAARERGLLLLSCGLYGNVIRILVPLVIGDADLKRGLELLEESLVDASASA
jgi:4-aminobutyrate aminotransferase / (S)-3-amino-2-methylpropionate transaminase / 5-aminovalerate transaminase